MLRAWFTLELQEENDFAFWNSTHAFFRKALCFMSFKLYYALELELNDPVSQKFDLISGYTKQSESLLRNLTTHHTSYLH